MLKVLYHIFLGAIPLVVCIVLRIILDLRIAPWIIMAMDKIPVRNLFRDKPIDLRGNWEQQWEANSQTFQSATDRHSNVKLYQVNRYCYAEFTAQGIRYSVLGRILNNHLFGEWYATKDGLGYYGAFELQIESADKMVGLWLGHSKKTNEIKHGKWTWDKTQ